MNILLNVSREVIIENVPEMPNIFMTDKTIQNTYSTSKSNMMNITAKTVSCFITSKQHIKCTSGTDLFRQFELLQAWELIYIWTSQLKSGGLRAWEAEAEAF